MDNEKTTAKETPQAYEEEKNGVFTKVKNAVKAHKKGIIVGSVTALLAGAGGVAYKVITGKDAPIDVAAIVEDAVDNEA